MKKFEYRTIRKFQSYEMLDELGDDGWELVSCSVYMEHQEKKFYYIFKKEKWQDPFRMGPP